MDIEEAIKLFEPGINFPDFPHTIDDVDEACRMAVAALRAQQTPAKLDRSRWEGCEYCLEGKGIVTFEVPDEIEIPEDAVKFGWVKEPEYCPICGRPLTEEAWAELERKIGGL